MQSLSISSAIILSNSAKLPQLGFGVYLSPANICTKSCLNALENGYRHIDTAQYYENENEVGLAVVQSGLRRQDVFLTTKILYPGGSEDLSYKQCVESVKKLDPEHEYVDLFLIHSPNCGGEQNRRQMWKALERLYSEGKAKSIGVSNFGIKHIEELRGFAKVWPPHVNQIELHPWSQQRQIVEYCDANGIAVEAYSPLVRNTKAQDATLVRISEKHRVATSQVLIRYCLQKGWAPLPKSDNPARIKANADVFGFALDDDDMQELDNLNQGAAGAIVEAVAN